MKMDLVGSMLPRLLPQRAIPDTNVGNIERVASIVGGTVLVVVGLRRRSRAGLSLAASGAMLVVRGVSGWCALYRTLGINRAAPADGTAGNLGVKVERAMLFDEPREKLYAFWREFRNLPTIMPNVESVIEEPGGRSHWVVKGPAGTTVEWDAEVINDRPNELIAWRTLPGARVEHAGSVRFEPQPGGRTLVRVSLQYDPPGGELAHMVSALFGGDPGKRIEEDLARLKEALGRAAEDRDGLQPATADALGYRRPEPGSGLT
jgi:uncharacterized membrane protein